MKKTNGLSSKDKKANGMKEKKNNNLSSHVATKITQKIILQKSQGGHV